MLEALNKLDTALFLFLNGLSSPFWDSVMDWISGRSNWIPLYIILTGFLVYRFRIKSIWIILGTIIAVSLSDHSSVHLFKEVFQRLRPCHQEALQPVVHLVNNHCGGQYGFVSSHAANHFAVAMFTALWVRRKWYWWTIMAWAAIIAYSRVYLGVHFPGDIIGGALLGILLAWGLFLLMLNLKFLKLRKK